MFHYHSDLYFFDLFVFINNEPAWKCEDYIIVKGGYGLCEEEVEYLVSETLGNLRGGNQSSIYDHTFVIYLSSSKDRSIDYGTLQHEIFHTVHDVMRTRGVKFSEGSEESFAYLTGHLTTVIYEYVFKVGSGAAKPSVVSNPLEHKVL